MRPIRTDTAELTRGECEALIRFYAEHYLKTPGLIDKGVERIAYFDARRKQIEKHEIEDIRNGDEWGDE